MKWLNFWKQDRPEMDDPVFGHITYHEKGRVWEGTATLGDQQVDLLIDAGTHGPSARQRERFGQLEQHLAEYRGEIEGAGGETAGSDWSLVVVDFQSEEPAPTRIELTFEHGSTEELLTIVVGAGLEVVKVLRGHDVESPHGA